MNSWLSFLIIFLLGYRRIVGETFLNEPKLSFLDVLLFVFLFRVAILPFLHVLRILARPYLHRLKKFYEI